ncbi:PREDICTED: aryl hydrocarbon receptor nuclear translocator-like protein 2 [Chrysochloris asiatica]|uniref:Aryl hydrocarbon receptor nuclear translocator-like protein 2 n=1 Tax=Chrysochloris asiatica TaxID=185453 RepID=A0A9B0WU37_CHRAS|nr:PREDICTED: aryl hydrocarbon receptor nuclear translocator-like protein 2 [Chrysochloris asiatica]
MGNKGELQPLATNLYLASPCACRPLNPQLLAKAQDGSAVPHWPAVHPLSFSLAAAIQRLPVNTQSPFLSYPLMLRNPGSPSASISLSYSGSCDKVLEEENQCMTSMVSSHMNPGTKPIPIGSFSPHVTEFPRKRKGSDSDPSQSGIMADKLVEKLSQNPITYLLSTRIGISASTGNRMEDGDQQVKLKSFREVHSQTEKRRRDKMNNLIEELSAMIPQCNPMARKLDKLTVLRMAVQHLKSLKGMTNSYVGDNYRPSFIQDNELRHLILKIAEGFLFVVGCDRGKILFVSKSVSKTLNYDQANLIGKSFFDFLHPKDVAKVKEQLSPSDISPRETLEDAKSGLQIHNDFHTGRTHVHSGSRRSFFCRIKSCKVFAKEEHACLPNARKKDHRKFYTIHCTGYLRSWPPNIVGMEEGKDSKKDGSNLTCLVAIGRLHSYIVPENSGEIKVKPAEFVTRFAVNGKFVFVDQRATAILGYLPQELLGTSCYEYFHQDDCSNLTEKHKAVLQSKEKIFTDSYKFRAKDGSFVTLKSQWFSFTNPWTKELEYIVSVNTLILRHRESGQASMLPCTSQSSEESSRQSCSSVPGISSGTVLGAASIGTDIVNEVLDFKRLQSSSSFGDSSPIDLIKDATMVNYKNVSNKELTPLSPSEVGELEATRQNQNTVALHSNELLLNDGAQLDFGALCDNDDTAMAAFMNYFEAEGGLGDPADFSDIQWTL